MSEAGCPVVSEKLAEIFTALELEEKHMVSVSDNGADAMLTGECLKNFIQVSGKGDLGLA